jgi:peptidoglycan L-alanyl-D-glutamate endopeptidase CwlK
MKLSNKSKSKLSECHQDIQKVINYAVEKDFMDFSVICGHRGKEAQEAAFNSGASKAHFGQSSHNTMPSNAVDIVPYPIDWQDIDRFKALGNFILQCAKDVGVTLYWGGNWPKFKDYPHFSLTNK